MASQKRFSPVSWEQRMSQIPISKYDLNRLVLDYLITEGYQDAAQSFAAEAARDLPATTAKQIEDASIEARVQIREAVERGDVQAGIEMCNDLDPEILDSHPHLHFHLLAQSLIELIRQGKTAEALAFAKKELAPRAERNEEFLKELEGVMCLLVYGATTPKDKSKGSIGKIEAPDELLELLSTQHRSLAAAELNSALLSSLSLGGQSGEPRLAGLLRLCAWGEDKLEKNGVEVKGVTIRRGEGAVLDDKEGA